MLQVIFTFKFSSTHKSWMYQRTGRNADDDDGGLENKKQVIVSRPFYCALLFLALIFQGHFDRGKCLKELLNKSTQFSLNINKEIL